MAQSYFTDAEKTIIHTKNGQEGFIGMKDFQTKIDTPDYRNTLVFDTIITDITPLIPMYLNSMKQSSEFDNNSVAKVICKILDWYVSIYNSDNIEQYLKSKRDENIKGKSKSIQNKFISIFDTLIGRLAKLREARLSELSAKKDQNTTGTVTGATGESPTSEILNRIDNVIGTLPPKKAESLVRNLGKQVLLHVYDDELPPIDAPDYLEKLGTKCPQIYDPCTGQELSKTKSTMRLIDQRTSQIRKMMVKSILGSVYGIGNQTDNAEFIEKIFLNPTITLDHMVKIRLAKGGIAGTDIFEVLSRLFVFFGGLNVNPQDGSNYKFMNKIDDTLEKPCIVYASAFDGLKDTICKATNDSGPSDVTLNYLSSVPIQNEQKSLYISSAKWKESVGDPSKEYDLDKLQDRYASKSNLVGKKNLTRTDIGVILFVKNKTDFEKKCTPSKALGHKSILEICTGENGKIYDWFYIKDFLETIRKSIFTKADCYGITPYTAFLKEYTTDYTTYKN